MVPFPFSFLSLLFFLMVPFDISRREFLGVQISFLLWWRCSKKIFSRWWKDAIFFHRAESYAAQKFLSVMNVQPKFFSSSVARCSQNFLSRPWQGAAEFFLRLCYPPQKILSFLAEIFLMILPQDTPRFFLKKNSSDAPEQERISSPFFFGKRKKIQLRLS